MDLLLDSVDYSSDNEECDDPNITLVVPEVDSSAIILETSPSRTPSPREETDSDAAALCSRPGSDDEEDLHQQWNAALYMLQSQAPVAKCVYTTKEVENCKVQYGREFHGELTRLETDILLGTEDGTYLVRQNVTGVPILSFRMNGRMYNYRLYYEDGLHYVGENKFEVLADLVQDGLITLYLQQHNVSETMQEGRMQSIARKKRKEKKLKLLKRVHGRRVKGLKGKKAWEYQRTISNTSLSSVRSPSPTPSPTHSPTASPVHSPQLDNERRTVILNSIPAVNNHTSSAADKDESNLDFRSGKFRRSTPNLPTPTEACNSTLTPHSHSGQRRTNSVSSLPIIKAPSDQSPANRYSVIISTLKDAVREDQKKELLRLDKGVVRLKTSKSDGKIDKTSYENGSIQSRTYSCHVPFASALERVADVSIKGTSTLSRSSLTALAKHTSGPKSPYYKAHQFGVHTYMGPTWCEVCHHFLWGLKQQGMRCKDCGMDIHKQCLPLAIQLECYPNKQCIKRVFGVDLTTLVKLEGGVIPQVLSSLFATIQSRDLSVEGFYRVSGQTSEVLCVKEKYDDGETVDLSQHLDTSVLTGAVKLYLRELPIPLITFDAYTEIMKATAAISDPEDHNTDWQLLIDALKLLPKAHYATLNHLAQHLYKIHLQSEQNRMTAQNLSVVFAPTLMRSPSDANSLIGDLPIQRTFIEYVILKNDIIFR